MENLESKRQKTEPRKVFVIITGSCGPSVSVEKYDKKIFKDFRNILETDKCKGIESGRDNGNSGGVPLARDCCGEFPRQ